MTTLIQQESRMRVPHHPATVEIECPKTWIARLAKWLRGIFK